MVFSSIQSPPLLGITARKKSSPVHTASEVLSVLSNVLEFLHFPPLFLFSPQVYTFPPIHPGSFAHLSLLQVLPMSRPQDSSACSHPVFHPPATAY